MSIKVLSAYDKIIKQVSKQGIRIPFRVISKTEEEIVNERTFTWGQLKRAFSTILHKEVIGLSTMKSDDEYKFISTFKRDNQETFVRQEITGKTSGGVDLVQSYVTEIGDKYKRPPPASFNDPPTNNTPLIVVGILAGVLIIGVIAFGLSKVEKNKNNR